MSVTFETFVLPLVRYFTSDLFFLGGEGEELVEGRIASTRMSG